MAETPDDVRRDIELTRERMSTTLDQLEHKLNVSQMVKENPWPAIGLAVAAGFILSGSRADVRAAAATVAATRGAQSRLGPVLDDLVSQVVSNVSTAFENRVTSWVDEIRDAIGTGDQQQGRPRERLVGQQQFGGGNRLADMPEEGSGYGAGNRNVSHQQGGLVSQSGNAGISGTPGGMGSDLGGSNASGYGAGPAHAGPNSFGNASSGTSPMGPGAGTSGTGSTGGAGTSGSGYQGHSSGGRAD